MAYFSHSFLDQLRSASDLVALISEDSLLKGQGDSFKGLCPFPEHNDKTPSFSVSQSKQLYHCFSCDNSGNIFTYLQKQKGMSFVDSVEYLANKHNIPLPKKQSYSAPVKNTFFKTNDKIRNFYKQYLKKLLTNHVVKQYLSKRQWTEQLIDDFDLGYAPKGNKLLNFFDNPEDKQDAKELGVIQHSLKTQTDYDNFRNRLIFPIISVQNHVVGFGARSLDDSLPKYINSKESQIFHKGHTFYGLNKSARYLQQQQVALVVEGYTDFLSLYQAGICNVVATLGTALTQKHAELLKKYVSSVILLFDGDEAGIKAREKSLALLLAAGLEVKFVSLEKSQDPDDFIKSQGPEAFKTKLKEAKDLFFDILQKTHAKLKQQGRHMSYLTEEIAPLLSVVQNSRLKSLYKQRFLDLFGQDASLINKDLTNLMRKQVAKPKEVQNFTKKPVEQQLISLKKSLESERLLLILCLKSEDLLQEFIKENHLALMKTLEIQNFFTQIIKHYRQKHIHFDSLTHLVINQLEDTRCISKMSYPIFYNMDHTKGRKRIFTDCIDSLKTKQQHSKVSELIAKIKMNVDKKNINNLKEIFQLTKQRLQQKKRSKL